MGDFHYRMLLALFMIQRDAEAILMHCHGYQRKEITTTEFVAGVEELAWKITQRAEETAA